MRPCICAPLIRVDDLGDGHYGAPRSSGPHRGVDYLCVPGEHAHSPVEGTVTRHGFPYAKDGGVDPDWHLVEITDLHGCKHKLFYVLPSLPVGTRVLPGDVVGVNQDISLRYSPRMYPHIHYEIILADGKTRIDPEVFFKDD